MVGLMATSSKKAYVIPKSAVPSHTHVWCTLSLYPCSSPLLNHISTGETQTQFCLSLCGFSGSWCTQGLFELSEQIWRECGFILNLNFPPPHHLAGVSLTLNMGYLFKVAPALCSHCSSIYCLSGASPLLLVMGYLLTGAPAPHSHCSSAYRLVIQWLRLHAFTARGILSLGKKISHALVRRKT